MVRKVFKPGNPFVESWEVEGSHGDIWKVSKRQDGTFACSCPAWKFARAPKPDCKHITATRADLVGTGVPFSVPISQPARIEPQRAVAAVDTSLERFTVRRKIFS